MIRQSPQTRHRDELLADSFRACRAITKQRASNFYYGLCLAPEPKRSALYAIYAWMREADDAVDEPVGDITRKLRYEQLASATEKVLASREFDEAVQHGPCWPAFAATLQEHDMPASWFDEMLTGLGDDLTAVELQTDEEMLLYCDRVAGMAGLACVRIWGLIDSASAEHADSLAIEQGRAFQLTNILRDYVDDLRSDPRRVYISAESLDAAGVASPEVLAEWSDSAACESLVSRLATRARDGYKAADDLNSLLSPDCRPVHAALTAIYRGILDRIEANPQSVASAKPVKLGKLTKLGIAARALASRVSAS
ncbi:MAG: phytoene/squalene synthase family protein [Planctomycetota bacterium]